MENHASKETLHRQTTLLQRHTQKSSFLEAPTEVQTNTQKSETPKTIRSLCRSDYIIVGLSLLIIPALAFGADDAAYGTDLLKIEATNLQGLLFGPVLRIAGVIGAVFGIIRSFQTQTLQPIFIFGGIGAATIIVPKLLDVMFKVT